ncbi:MAG: hypothetical protein ABI960_01235 [Candidatus Eisenbacteria bacterium]
MVGSIADVLNTAWLDFMGGVQAFLPHLFAMLSLVIAGFLIAWAMSFVLRHVLRWVKFDVLADRFGAGAALKKVTLPEASVVVASMVFWLVWAAFLLSGLGALGFSGVENLSAEFIAFLPRLVVGIVILVIGMAAANFAWRATLLSAVNSNLPSARLLSGAVRWLLVALTVAMALEQVGVAKMIMLTAFAIAFGAIMLGVAIAIGIGGGQVARRMLERQFPEPPKDGGRSSDEVSHL